MPRVLLICDGADPGALATLDALLRDNWPGVERIAANTFAGELSGKRCIDLPETLAYEGPPEVTLIWVRAEVVATAEHSPMADLRVEVCRPTRGM